MTCKLWICLLVQVLLSFRSQQKASFNSHDALVLLDFDNDVMSRCKPGFLLALHYV
jgi:hypothetical protein